MNSYLVLFLAVNIAPTAFEAMATIVCTLTKQLPDKNDIHGRSSLLTQYIHYCASLTPSNRKLNNIKLQFMILYHHYLLYYYCS